eukprot:14758668-Alexandrium_andersonii.AAC.1
MSEQTLDLLPRRTVLGKTPPDGEHALNGDPRLRINFAIAAAVEREGEVSPNRSLGANHPGES